MIAAHSFQDTEMYVKRFALHGSDSSVERRSRHPSHPCLDDQSRNRILGGTHVEYYSSRLRLKRQPLLSRNFQRACRHVSFYTPGSCGDEGVVITPIRMIILDKWHIHVETISPVKAREANAPFPLEVIAPGSSTWAVYLCSFVQPACCSETQKNHPVRMEVMEGGHDQASYPV